MIWKHLEDVPPHHNFKLNGGGEAKNLYELGMHLAAMNDATFSHHVNGEKNDFLNWVDDIVQDNKLSARISKAKTRGKMAKIVERRVKYLETEKKHHEKVTEHGFKWGVREFGIGLATGLFLGFIFFKMTGIL